MEERQLGRSGLRVSVIGFGAWGIGGNMWKDSDDARSMEALRAALESGCTFIDTALVYGEGHSERLIARVLADWKRRVTVATKVPPKNRTWPALPGIGLKHTFPAAHVRRCAEQSAQRLQRPIDLFQLHVWRDEWLLDPDWKTVEKTVEHLLNNGTVKAFGISLNDHEPDNGLEAVRNCALVTSVQVIYNVFDQSPQHRLFPLCMEKKCGVIARVPLDEGALSGRITAETKFPPGDWRREYFEGDRKAQVEQHVNALRPVLLEEAGSLVEGALRFCISHPAVSTVIPGMRTAEHARANCAVGDGRKLSPALLKRLEAHAWDRNFYPVPDRPGGFRPLLVIALLLLALWIVLGFVVPLGAGWVHLLLPAGVLLLVRDVVTRSGD